MAVVYARSKGLKVRKDGSDPVPDPENSAGETDRGSYGGAYNSPPASGPGFMVMNQNYHQGNGYNDGPVTR